MEINYWKFNTIFCCLTFSIEIDCDKLSTHDLKTKPYSVDYRIHSPSNLTKTMSCHNTSENAILFSYIIVGIKQNAVQGSPKIKCGNSL